MHDFLAGFNSPESVWLIKMTYFPFLQRISKNGNSVNFSPKPHYFTIKPPLVHYIGNVSTMYDFLAGFSSPGIHFGLSK